jgi:hypothetical protein
MRRVSDGTSGSQRGGDLRCEFVHLLQPRQVFFLMHISKLVLLFSAVSRNSGFAIQMRWDEDFLPREPENVYACGLAAKEKERTAPKRSITWSSKQLLELTEELHQFVRHPDER